MRGRAAAGLLAALLLLPAGGSGIGAAEVAGVRVPEGAVLGGGGGDLVLNGAGVRKKLFVKVYVGALYLPEKTADARIVLDTPGARRITMHFLYREVERAKLVEAWDKGFSSNLSPGEMAVLEGRLKTFNGLFRTALSGDIYRLDCLPGKGTSVYLNDEKLGSVEGDDFSRALLKVWLGPNPADKNLKKALLGG